MLCSAVTSVHAQDKHIVFDKNHTRLQWVKTIPGDKTVNVFFLPGGPGVDSASLIPLIEKMTVPGNYWLIDLPGNGTNIHDQMLSDKTFERWGDNLVEALEPYDNPILIGHSFGGFLPLFCPKLEGMLKGLVILNSTPTLDSPIFAQTVQKYDLPSLAQAQALFVEKKSVETLRDLYRLEAEYFFSKKYREAGIKQIINKLEFSISAEYWWYTQGPAFYKAITWVPQQTPTLIISGSEDKMTPLSVFESDARFKRDNIKMLEIKGAGHFPWLEQPEAVKKAIELSL